MLIVLEGADSAGKTFHAERLAKRLNATLDSYPNYSTPVGQMIRQWLMGKWWVDAKDTDVEPLASIEAHTFQALQVMNRLEHLDALKVSMAKGDVVLSRYFMSGVVYGSDDGIPAAWLESIHSVFPQPDLHILLDIDVETSLSRRPERRDVYEKQTDKMKRVVDLYRNIWNARQYRDAARWAIVNARGAKEETAAQIDAAVARAREAKVAA